MTILKILPSTDKQLAELNHEQREAVTTTDGVVRVIAGPGTGKTRVLTHRLSYLVNQGVDPDKILSVTFTNKAAREMRERARQLLPFDATTHISTFHGFCYTFFKRNIHLLNYPEPFPIIDQNDQVNILREIFSEWQLSARDISPARIIKEISIFKASGSDYVGAFYSGLSDDVLSSLGFDVNDPFQEVMVEYLRRQRQTWALDFDDMLFFALYILKKEPELLKQYQKMYHYIQVDEYQDVNPAQVELVDLLHQHHGNLCVVGDPDQTIYTWRGSDIRFITDFEKWFPGAKNIILKNNYRSASSIVESSNELIRHNQTRVDKPLEPIRQQVGKVIHCSSRNIYDEAEFICEVVQSLRQHNHASFSDIAIFYRSSHLSRCIEHELRNHRIPYQIVKGTEFFNRQEIRDALAYLKLIAFDDDIGFLRIVNRPARGIGPSRLREIKNLAHESGLSYMQALIMLQNSDGFKSRADIKEFIASCIEIKAKADTMTTSKILKLLLLKTGYEEMLLRDPKTERIENVRELIQSIIHLELQYGGMLKVADYLAEVALYSETLDQEQMACVQLMTIHSAKGLEFPYVIVAGMNENILPSAKAESHAQLEEERRLAYVAFTRAKDGLILTSPGGYDHNNRPLTPSRFVNEAGNIKKLKRPNNYI